MDRYFVDSRGGCIAVRDREHTDPDYNGLHSDTEGVIKYWDGHRTEKKCSTCGQVHFTGWEVSKEDEIAALELCNSLNGKSSKVCEESPEDETERSDPKIDTTVTRCGEHDSDDLLDWAKTLLCMPMAHCTQADWDVAVKRWRDEKHDVSTPNARNEGQNEG